jgi:hypothetical protein
VPSEGVQAGQLPDELRHIFVGDSVIEAAVK